MLVSELIELLQRVHAEYGEIPVMVDSEHIQKFELVDEVQDEHFEYVDLVSTKD